MMPAIDMTGTRAGRLMVTRRIGSQFRKALWECVCDCGNVIAATGINLRLGRIKSCGCLKSSPIHGNAGRGRKTAEYLIWVSMRQRCRNPNNKNFHRYGGRGIDVCARWESFENFLEDVGVRPSDKHSIDRIDNSKGYSPGNCKWSTAQEQASNTRRNHLVTIDGKRVILTVAVARLGLHYGTVVNRIRRGESVERALRIS